MLVLVGWIHLQIIKAIFHSYQKILLFRDNLRYQLADHIQTITSIHGVWTARYEFLPRSTLHNYLLPKI